MTGRSARGGWGPPSASAVGWGDGFRRRAASVDRAGRRLGRGLGTALASALLSLGPQPFLIAAPMALPLLLAPAAQAQTTTLLDNLRTTNTISNRPTALKFTTGSKPAILTEVQLGVSGGNGRTPMIRIREAPMGNPGGPARNPPNNAVVATLTGSTGSNFTNYSFTAPANTILKANSSYYLSLNDGVTNDSDLINFGYISRSDHASALSGVKGWAVDELLLYFQGGFWVGSTSSALPTFQIRGSEITLPGKPGGLTA
ncbi:MAG: hypothetical protein OXF25_11355, partial [Cyanobacteria bacterium MAG CAR3_bin_5]|nr:hypothetical protein [Cyanobacteria bacterium MAG CAR3_bin_5]